MSILYKILFILLISPIYLWSQIDWMGDVYVNKYFFNEPNDSLIIEISVKKDGFTSQDPNPQTLRCKVLLHSSKYRQSNSIIQASPEIEMSFDSRIEDKYKFKTTIPVNSLDQGRYSIDIICTDDNWNSYKSLNKFIPKPLSITIGKDGFVRIMSDFRINNDIFKYSLLDFENQFDLLPYKLSGTYSEGFCKDEIVDLNSLWFHIWSTSTTENIELKSYYSIDDGEFIDLGKAYEYDNSSDGTLQFDKLNIKHLYSNDDVTDYSIKAKIELKDILNLVDINTEELHNIKLYFVLNTPNGDLRFPEQGYVETVLRISDSPQGADCQAELLPIDLLSFDIIKSGKSVYIKWVTISEVNNDNFEIQRSTDTREWDILATIDGKGDTNEQNKYEYIDKFPFGGESYYRLKQNDFDGREKYSKVKVIYNFENKLTIYPNPASDYLLYNIRDINNDFDVLIFDSLGRIVKRFILPDRTQNNFKVDISYLKKGIYYIKYVNKQNHQIKVYSFIKE